VSFFTKKPPVRPTNQTPAMPFRSAPAAPLAFAGFECLRPDPRFATVPYRRVEKGQYIPYIKADGILPMMNLPAKLLELINHCWTAASAANGAQRGPLQIGMNAAPKVAPAHLPSPNHSRGVGTRQDQMQGKASEYVKQIGPLSQHEVARDWKLIADLERVNAYTFRGDKHRSPKDIEAAGGFHPPITRTDQRYVDEVIYPYFRDYLDRRFGAKLTKQQFAMVYNKQVVPPKYDQLLSSYFEWRGLVETESFHVPRMVRNQDLKAYVSTTRHIRVAERFATTDMSKDQSTDGWVYVTHVRGGFNIPPQTQWVKIDEQEIAYCGSIAWDDVVAFRECVAAPVGLTGPIYLRQSFQSRNPSACREVFEVLSGKQQKAA
jgi:hypothetical protein